MLFSPLLDWTSAERTMAKHCSNRKAEKSHRTDLGELCGRLRKSESSGCSIDFPLDQSPNALLPAGIS